MSREEDNLDLSDTPTGSLSDTPTGSLCDTPTGSNHMSHSSNHTLTESGTFHDATDSSNNYDVKPSESLMSCSSVIGVEELVDYDEIVDEFSSPVLHRKQIRTNIDHDLNYSSDSDSNGHNSVIETSPEKNCGKSETLLQPGKSFLVKDKKEDERTQEAGMSRKRHSNYSDSSDGSALDKLNLSKIFKLSPKVPEGKRTEVDIKRTEVDVKRSSEKCVQDSGGGGVCKQKSSLSKGGESMKTISRQDLKLVKEMFPDIDDDRIRKRFSDLLRMHEDNILERLIESILKTQESSSPSLETNQSTHDIQAALGNPRPNLQRQESGSSTASGHSEDLRRKCVRGLKWRKGSSASSNKGKGLAKKSQQVSYPDSDVNMMDLGTYDFDDNNVSHSNDDMVVPVIEKHPVSISEVSSSQLKCDACGTSHDTVTISQCCDTHLVCKTCVEKQVKRVISHDSQETQISCPANGCKTYIPESQASKVLPSLIMELLEEKLNKKAMESITKMDDLHSCPFCEFPVAVDHGLKKFLCPNPDCQTLSCRYCKKIWLNIDHTSCTAFMTLSEESKEHLELPRYWHPIPEEQKDFILVELDRNGREFTLIKDQFLASMVHIVPISIRRIQNPRLWQKFSLARKHMSEDFGPNLINEQQLFHGTKVEAIEAICRDGLDWRMCGENGVAFGQGTYFAKNARYSDKYCIPYSGQLGNLSQPFGFTLVRFPVSNAPHPMFGPTVVLTGNALPLPANPPNPTGYQNNQFNALGGIGTQTGFGTVTFGTPFGPEKSSQTTGCVSNAPNGKIPQVTSDVKQILQVQHKYMFVARVLVGRPGQGRHGMRKPPEDPSDPKGRAFNSCVDFVDRPSIFVIFDSTQCYPEYLIEYVHLK